MLCPAAAVGVKPPRVSAAPLPRSLADLVTLIPPVPPLLFPLPRACSVLLSMCADALSLPWVYLTLCFFLIVPVSLFLFPSVPVYSSVPFFAQQLSPSALPVLCSPNRSALADVLLSADATNGHSLSPNKSTHLLPQFSLPPSCFLLLSLSLLIQSLPTAEQATNAAAAARPQLLLSTPRVFIKPITVAALTKHVQQFHIHQGNWEAIDNNNKINTHTHTQKSNMKIIADE